MAWFYIHLKTDTKISSPLGFFFFIKTDFMLVNFYCFYMQTGEIAKQKRIQSSGPDKLQIA
jgi:hypothetical protein